MELPISPSLFVTKRPKNRKTWHCSMPLCQFYWNTSLRAGPRQPQNVLNICERLTSEQELSVKEVGQTAFCSRLIVKCYFVIKKFYLPLIRDLNHHIFCYWWLSFHYSLKDLNPEVYKQNFSRKLLIVFALSTLNGSEGTRNIRESTP